MAKKTKVFQIWSEGFVATGESGTATHHGMAEGTDFKDACKTMARHDAEFRKYFSEENMSHWGCKLFDNEEEARATFG